MFLESLLDTSDFAPRWFCGHWTALHGWVHILSDLAIFGAYFAIPVVLIYFIRMRNDIPFLPIFYLFSAFILSCGIGHAIEATIFWQPWYRLSGLVKVITAIISWATVLALIPLVPRALALPGLALINDRLLAEINSRNAAEESLKRLNEELEMRVQMRTVQLQAANEEWEQSVNALNEHVCILDQEGTILRANKVAQDHFKSIHGTLAGGDHRQIYFANSNPDLRSVCNATFVEGKAVVLESALPALDGWYQISCFPLTDREHKLWGAVLVIRNLTLERRAEETLRTFNSELEERVRNRTSELASRTSEFELVVRSLPDTVLRVKEDGTVVFSKVSPAEGILRFESCLTPCGKGRACPACAIVEKALAIGAQSRIEGGAQIAEMEISGQVLELRVAPLSLGDFLVLVRDISARHKLEVELSNALKHEKELSELKSHFFSVASHEFRTPLSAVTGSVDLLQNFHDQLSQSKRLELLERIATGSSRLTSIMDDVLTLSRIEAGKVEVKKVATDLAAFFSDIVDEAKFADKKEHVLHLSGTSQGKAVETDPKLLRHIVSNLISNAMRYSPERSLVQLAFGADERAFWFEVRDEGIGIPEKDHAHLFEPFFRASNAGSISGTGLGLNIVKRYTDLLGGTIAIVRVDKGACFRAEFPCA